MELFEYVRLRAATLIALFVVGVLIIVAAAQVRGGSSSRASADVLVQPSATQAQSFAADPDRYVNTQLSVLRSSSALLRGPARQVGLSEGDLADALTASHGAQTDIATLTVTLADSDKAVRAVNAVSDSFVDYLRGEGAFAPGGSLQRQIDSVSRQLGEVGTRIQQATRRARADSGSGASTDPFVVAPRAAGDQAALNQKLNQLTQQQAEQDSDASQNPSRVLHAADESISPLRGNIVTLFSAIVGWALLLLLAAAVGMTLSRRILGRARWERITAGSSLGRAVQLPRRSSGPGSRSVEHVVAAVESTGSAGDAVTVACLPSETPRLRRRTVPLTDAIESESSRRCSFAPDLGATLAAGPAGHADDSPVVVLLVDVTKAEVGDAELLTRLDDARAEKILPVLV